MVTGLSVGFRVKLGDIWNLCGDLETPILEVIEVLQFITNPA